MYERAEEIARAAHAGQLRWDGSPYIGHPIRIAEAVSDDPDARVVAILHDVVEDSDISLDDLRREFPAHIVAAVDAVSRREDEIYREFIERAALDPLARRVKLADIEDHLRDLPAERASLRKRYERAKSVLEAMYE